MEKKNIKRDRMMRIFIDAAAEIIITEGADKVTIRKVGDVAGYNSATIYNYFENLEHLISLASMKFMKDYTNDLPKCLKKGTNTFEKAILIWTCFCKHSFKSPEIYYSIFFNNLSKPTHRYFKEFYSIYTEYLAEMSEMVSSMLIEDDIYDRSLVLLKECSKHGFFKEEDLIEINEITYYIYKGMLSDVLHNKFNGTIEEAVEKTIKYIYKIFKAHLQPTAELKIEN